MLKSSIPLVVGISVLLTSEAARANNTFFLPGDAFFFARLSEEDVVRLGKEKSPIVEYGSHWNNGYFCGYAGYARLQLVDMPPAVKKGLAEAVERLKDELEKDAKGIGRASVFICRSDYDWRKFGLGLQYNEHWVEETARFGHDKSHLRLETFIDTGDALMRGWRDAKAVAPLATEVPKLPEKFAGAWDESPVVVQGEKVQLLIIPDRSFGDYLIGKDGLRVFVVTKEGLDFAVFHDGEWKP